MACAWPYADVPEQRVVFDETEMAAVIERSRRTAVTRRPRPAQTAPPPAVLRTPARWDVTVWLTPAELLQGARHDWDAEVAAIAETAHANDWTSDFVDDFLREYEVARHAAPEGDEFGWFGRVPGAYQLTFPVFARSQDEARRRASSRLQIPNDWSVHLTSTAARNSRTTKPALCRRAGQLEQVGGFVEKKHSRPSGSGATTGASISSRVSSLPRPAR